MRAHVVRKLFRGKRAQTIDRSVDRWAPDLLVLTFMTVCRGRFARVEISDLKKIGHAFRRPFL